jgi:hypothetical protein
VVMDASFNTTDAVSFTLIRWDVCCAICRLRADCMTWAATMEPMATCWIMTSVGQLIHRSLSDAKLITGRVYR